jgi:UDP-N-acetylmuramoylalanine-D-glutamate ligase
MKLRGMHNVENVAAAFAAGIAAGASSQSMKGTVRRFDPVEHRIEFVTEIDGVKFYNDSKATSVDATLKALEAFAHEQGKIVLILGGKGKKAPYAPLEPLVTLPPRERRRTFAVLVASNVKTLDGNLAFLYQVNLLLNRQHVPQAAGILYSALRSHQRLYKPFLAALRE